MLGFSGFGPRDFHVSRDFRGFKTRGSGFLKLRFTRCFRIAGPWSLGFRVPVPVGVGNWRIRWQQNGTRNRSIVIKIGFGGT